MALEVNEIGIRMHVRDANAKAGDSDEPDGDAADVIVHADRDDIVEECVRRVLRALKLLQER